MFLKLVVSSKATYTVRAHKIIILIETSASEGDAIAGPSPRFYPQPAAPEAVNRVGGATQFPWMAYLSTGFLTVYVICAGWHGVRGADKENWVLRAVFGVLNN